MGHDQIYGYFWLLDNQSCSFIGTKWVKLSCIWKCKYNWVFLLLLIKPGNAAPFRWTTFYLPWILLDLMCQRHFCKQSWHDLDQIKSREERERTTVFSRVTPFPISPCEVRLTVSLPDKSIWAEHLGWPEKHLSSLNLRLKEIERQAPTLDLPVGRVSQTSKSLEVGWGGHVMFASGASGSVVYTPHTPNAPSAFSDPERKESAEANRMDPQGGRALKKINKSQEKH